MNFFEKKRMERRLKEAGGPYGLVAQNMAAIYYAISFTPYGKQLNERRHLAATALIDAVGYYNEGKITPKDIAADIAAASNGEICLIGTTKKNGVVPAEENAMLIAVTMQIAARMQKISENKFSLFYDHYDHIIDPIIMNKPLIADMIKQTLAEGRKSKAYADCIKLVNETCAIPEFQRIINAF